MVGSNGPWWEGARGWEERGAEGGTAERRKRQMREREEMKHGK